MKQPPDERATYELRRLATEVMTGLAGAGIPTPAEGYVAAWWAVAGDIGRLARERDRARAEAASWEVRALATEAALTSAGAALAAIEGQPVVERLVRERDQALSLAAALEVRATAAEKALAAMEAAAAAAGRQR